MEPLEYRVPRTADSVVLDGQWDHPLWLTAQEGRIAHFRPRGSDHHPDVRFRMLHDNQHLFLRFVVQDRYVRSIQTQLNSSVCTDSCVEFFVQPKPERGYFNFEVNAGGTLLLSYIRDCTSKKRQPGGV